MFKSTAISLIGGLLLRLFIPLQFPLFTFKKPAFIEHIPPGHYLGISGECSTLVQAREDSIQNAIKQIFLQIGAEYQLEYEKLLYAKDTAIDVSVTDRISYNSAGILGDVEVKDSYYEKPHDRYICYSLVYFPQTRVLRARQLIEEENNRRLVLYNSFIERGNNAESSGAITDALSNYRLAIKQAEGLFKEKNIKGALAQGHVEDIVSRVRLEAISNYHQRDRHYVMCRVLYDHKPISDIPVKFSLQKGSGAINQLIYSDESGSAQCNVNVKTGYTDNEIRALVAIEGVDSYLTFNFSTIEPKPIISASPLEIRDNCFIFELKESNDVDAVFNRYEITLNAEYKNASFINYYVARVDSSKNACRAFDLLNTVIIKGGSSQIVKIPFNGWLREKIAEMDKWYMGSRLDYRLTLKGDETYVTLK